MRGRATTIKKPEWKSGQYREVKKRTKINRFATSLARPHFQISSEIRYNVNNINSKY